MIAIEIQCANLCRPTVQSMKRKPTALDRFIQSVDMSRRLQVYTLVTIPNLIALMYSIYLARVIRMSIDCYICMVVLINAWNEYLMMVATTRHACIHRLARVEV
jgi:hypothetical protein